MKKKELIDHLLQVNTDDLFVEEAYRLIIGRSSDPDGLKSALARLKTGTSRETIIVDMFFSPEVVQGNKGQFQLSLLEKITILLWKKRQDIYSWLRAIRHLASIRLKQAASFDFIFDLQNNLSSQNNKLTDLQSGLNQQMLQHVEQIKSEVIHFQLMESQAQQRRLDQFFFDARQELGSLNDKDNIVEKIESISQHGIDQYYLALEESYRGSRDEIIARYEPYMDLVKPLLSQTKEIKAMDLGCGRGEWLQILSKRCSNTIGIDSNTSMIAECRTHGLNAEQGDLIEWLQLQAERSFDLITAFHVIEYLSFQQLNELMAEIYRTLTDGGMVILETPNPDNLYVAANMFYRDPTRKKPIPKELSERLLNYHGFTDTKVHPMHPFPKEMRLIENNELTRRFNLLMYGAQDYLITGKKHPTNR